jgi:hypothetical protein
MTADHYDYLVESLVVEIKLLGDAYSPRDLIIGLLAACVEVAGAADIPPDYVRRMALRVVDAGFDA